MSEISLEDIATYPYPGLTHPIFWRFSPDERLISCLYSPDLSLRRNLLGLHLPDIHTSKDFESAAFPLLSSATDGVTDSNITLAEALRRERARQLGQGITDYTWQGSADGSQFILVPLRGSLFIQKISSGTQEAEGPLELLYDGTEHPALDPQLSPDGQWVAFVRCDELCVVPSAPPAAGCAPAEAVQLTEGARAGGVTHGLAEYVAQEEMDRPHGFWWSPDSSRLAFAEVDERHIPPFRILHSGKEQVGEEAQEDHRYPFAGAANALVRLGVVSRCAQPGPVAWMALGGDWEYLARVHWLQQGLFVQLQNRAQTELRLLRCDPLTGQCEPLLTETSASWINLHHLFYPLPPSSSSSSSSSSSHSSPGFVWGSERSGFMHLYFYRWDGTLVAPLTSGDWVVTELCAATADALYFMATLDSPMETHLYTVPLPAQSTSLQAPFLQSPPRRLTSPSGTHQAVLSPSRRWFIDVHSALDCPPTVRLCALADGAAVATLFSPSDPRLARLSLALPRLAPIPGTPLLAACFAPDAAAFGPGPHPLVVYCYGGPSVQLVVDAWSLRASLRVQRLVQQGFAVLIVDNRGSARRGLSFEAAVRWRMGDLEVQDQAAGVRWMAAQGLADPRRVGIYGWSYGGYLSAMCLCSAPDVFHVAVSGAPVTHWAKYDTHYTERYMGTPQENQEGYRVSAVMHHVPKLAGRLLIVHGLIDENVHFRHTAALINALIQHRKDYDLLLFPDERHAPRKIEDRVYMEQRIFDYFLNHLLKK